MFLSINQKATFLVRFWDQKCFSWESGECMIKKGNLNNRSSTCREEEPWQRREPPICMMCCIARTERKIKPIGMKAMDRNHLQLSKAVYDSAFLSGQIQIGKRRDKDDQLAHLPDFSFPSARFYTFDR